MDIKKVTFIIASSLVLCFMASAQSKLISINEKGKLSYHSYTDKGDLLPDFSFCGYKGGGVAIPLNIKTCIRQGYGNAYPAWNNTTRNQGDGESCEY